MKRITSIVLALVMILSFMTVIPSVAAAEITTPGGDGESLVTLTFTARNLRVTVPSVLPIEVDSDNNVTVAANAKISNLSEGPIEVTNVSVESRNGWSIVPFDTDFTKVPVDTKQYGMTMYDDDVVDGVSALLFDIIPGEGDLAVTYNGNVAIQSDAIDHLDIGHVVFTVSWNSGERLGPNDITYNVENDAVQRFMSTPAYDDDDHSYTYLEVEDCTTANRTPAYGILSAPDNTASITVTSEDDGKSFTDTVTGSEYHVRNLIPGIVYNYQMKDSSNAVLKSGKIYPTGTVRMVGSTDSSTVSNMRDIGGLAANGGTVKYGKLYRGEALNGTNTTTQNFADYMGDFLGVTFEQDLRQTDEYPEYTSSIIKNADYLRTPLTAASASSYYSSGPVQKTAVVVKALAEHLADGDTVFLHCAGGEDRTGGAIFFIEGALGISLSDIEKHQELSFWSNRARNISSDASMFEQLFAQNFRGDTLEEKCINFLMIHGVSADTINRMRANLIDGTPSIVYDIPNDELADQSEFLLNKRMSSADLRDNNGTLVTNYIEFVPEMILDVSTDTSKDASAYSGWFEFYDEDYNVVGKGTSTYGTWHWNADGKSARWIAGDASYNTSYKTLAPNVKYIRFCFAYNDPSSVSITRIF